MGKAMRMLLEICAMVFAFIAAVLWFMSAAGDLPQSITYWDATPPNDPFYAALQASVRWSRWAAVAAGISALCTVVNKGSQMTGGSP